MSQDDVSEKLGLSGECKRRTMTRYEKGNRNPKDLRTLEIANIFKVDVNSIKQYDFKNLIDIIYTLLWLEELIPNYKLNLDKVQITNNVDINKLKDFVNEWEEVRNRKINREISYEDYIEWKLNYKLKE